MSALPRTSPPTTGRGSTQSDTVAGVASPAGISAPARHTSPLRRLAFIASNVVLALAVLVVAIGVTGSVLGWWRAETVLSGSMRPGINPGDVEILTHEPTSDLRVGQILAFHPPHWQATVTHRVIALNRVDGRTYIRTKGDANPSPDPWGRVHVEGSKVWVVDTVIPKLGYVTVWARTDLIRLLLATGIVLFVCGMLLVRIWRRT